MSNHLESPEPIPQPVDAESARPSINPIRLGILLLFLLLVVGGFAYDRLVAKPNSEAGYETVMELVEKKNVQPIDAPPITNEDVANSLGFAPSVTRRADAYTEERYDWRRGLPVLTYPVYVYYLHGKDGGLHLHTGTLHEPASVTMLPGASLLEDPPPPAVPADSPPDADTEESA